LVNKKIQLQTNTIYKTYFLAFILIPFALSLSKDRVDHGSTSSPRTETKFLTFQTHSRLTAF